MNDWQYLSLGDLEQNDSGIFNTTSFLEGHKQLINVVFVNDVIIWNGKEKIKRNKIP